jgi:hypothetical protein
LNTFRKLDWRDVLKKIGIRRRQVLGGSERGISSKTHILLCRGLIIQLRWHMMVTVTNQTPLQIPFCDYPHLHNSKVVIVHFTMQPLTKLWHPLPVAFELTMSISMSRK